MPSSLQTQAQMLQNRLTKKAKHLKKWARRHNVTCYRLYDRDIPEIPLVIDWYDGRVHVAEYARRSTSALSEAQHAQWLFGLVTAVRETLGAAEKDVYVKRRQRQRGKAQYDRVSQEASKHCVEEGGLQFVVNLSDYLDTGLFIDHRLSRQYVMNRAKDKSVLNLFCYTGAFSVYAAAGGARRTLGVDLSKTYLRWARENLIINGFSNENMHMLAHADTGEFLRGCTDSFDIIVLDPPTFSNSKRMTRTFDVLRDHGALLSLCMAKLAQGGFLFFSTNAKRFVLDQKALSRFTVEDVTAATTSEDFATKRGHRAWVLKGDR